LAALCASISDGELADVWSKRVSDIMTLSEI